MTPFPKCKSAVPSLEDTAPMCHTCLGLPFAVLKRWVRPIAQVVSWRWAGFVLFHLSGQRQQRQGCPTVVWV